MADQPASAPAGESAAPQAAQADDPAIQALLTQGLAHHSEGRLDEARAAYEEVRARAPDNADALHLLGLLTFEAGHAEEGVALVQLAIAKAPKFTAAITNLATMLRQMRREGEAMGFFRKSVELKPDSPAGHRDLGYALLQQGAFDEAAEQLTQAVQLDPEDHVAHVGLGLARLNQRRLPEAEASLRHALGLRPAAHEIHLNLGACLRMQGRLDEAIGSFRVSLLLRPNYPEALLNLTATLVQAGRVDEAMEFLPRALEANAERGEIHLLHGQIQRGRGDIDGAVASLNKAVTLMADPSVPYNALASLLRAAGRRSDIIVLEQNMVSRRPASVPNRIRLAQALAHVGRLDEAVAACQRAMALDPKALDATSTLASIRSIQGRHDDARKGFEEVLAANPAHAGARASLAALDLAAGDLAGGFARFEARFDMAELAAFRAATPRLPPLAEAGDLAGKRILLAAEQGIGDTLQFVRYAPLLAERGATVLLEVQPPLVPLLEGMQGVAAVTAQGGIAPEFDFTSPMMSLPHVFGTTLDTIPAAVPYLRAPAAQRERWRARLAAGGPARRIGLCWSGNPGYSADMFRSIPLALLRPLLAMPELRFHLLQTDIRDGDDALIAEAPATVDLRRDLADFADTAAVVEQMDLVITADTSIAHLAGALGRPVWIMLPYSADWRWLRDRDDSPWYPTVRLFRQGRFNDWPPVIEAVLAALRSR
jgi:tetratricopeptide (TPR) repeat protein